MQSRVQQVVQALQAENLRGEDTPELPGDAVGEILKEQRFCWEAGLNIQAGDPTIDDSTGNNPVEVSKVSGAVQGEAVRRNASGDMNADGGNLFLCDASSRTGPNPGATWYAVGEQLELRAGADQDFFEVADVIDCAHTRCRGAKVEYRIAD